MLRECEIRISPQGKLMLARMPSIKESELLEWFCKTKKISIGGGDVVTYLSHLNDKAKGGG